MSNRMILNETSYFGKDSLKNITTEIKKRRFTKALIVTDKNLVEHGIVKKVTALLDQEQLKYSIYDGVIANPTIVLIEVGIECFKSEKADYLIAIGGGSPQDTAKAIGIVINNPQFQDIRSLEGLAATTKPAVPIIAIPTTSGTAAEVTINYVITDVEKRRKFVCIDPHSIPVVAIIDPDMMVSMPPSIKASTGIDALTHAIEGYTTKGAWELTDALHIKSIEMISNSLRCSVKGDADGINKMALAQYIAGMGFSNVGLGLVHGMAHPLGAFYNTPHGIANAILLPYVMAYNAEYTGEKFRNIALVMKIKDAFTMPLTDVRKAAVNAVKQLSKDVGIPAHLKDIGVKKEDISELAKSALADVCTGGNPRDASLQDIKALYIEAYE